MIDRTATVEAIADNVLVHVMQDMGLPEDLSDEDALGLLKDAVTLIERRLAAARCF